MYSAYGKYGIINTLSVAVLGVLICGCMYMVMCAYIWACMQAYMCENMHV
jgi:hypothetical protein